jgi:hypothetical protein
MFQQYENDFQFRIKLPNGKFIYRLEEDEADAVKEAIAQKKSIPPPKYRRLLPFGEGVEVVGDRIFAYYKGANLGMFPTLKKALKAWDGAERYERFSLEQEAEQQAIDKRYYSDLTFDENGYKIFKPRPAPTP